MTTKIKHAFMVGLFSAGIDKILSAVLLTILLNILWYISLSFGAGKPEYLVPLLIASMVIGTIIGFLSRWLINPGNTNQQPA